MRRVLRLAGEQPIDRKEAETVLGRRLAKLLERETVVGQLCEEGKPRLALASLEPVEQPCRLKGFRAPFAHNRDI